MAALAASFSRSSFLARAAACSRIFFSRASFWLPFGLVSLRGKRPCRSSSRPHAVSTSHRSMQHKERCLVLGGLPVKPAVDEVPEGFKSLYGYAQPAGLSAGGFGLMISTSTPNFTRASRVVAMLDYRSAKSLRTLSSVGRTTRVTRLNWPRNPHSGTQLWRLLTESIALQLLLDLPPHQAFTFPG